MNDAVKSPCLITCSLISLKTSDYKTHIKAKAFPWDSRLKDAYSDTPRSYLTAPPDRRGFRLTEGSL